MLSEKADTNLSDMMLRHGTEQTRMQKMMSLGWLGQTVASLCWILSVFAYGISTTGDWLQPVSYTHLTLPTNREV